MKVMIKYRLFLAMLAATTLAVVSMFLIMQWSFSRGFLTYINRVESERLERLADIMEDSFQKEGGWNALKKDPALWPKLLTESLRREGSDPESADRVDRRPAPRMEQQGVRRPPAQRFAHRFETRVLLLDAGRHFVAGASPKSQPGTTPDDKKINIKPLMNAGKTVGYLELLPRQHVTDTRQLRFLKEQKSAMGMIAAVMLVVSTLISLPLANNLVRPIKTIADSIHRLASGSFDTRVPVRSSDELGQLAKDFNALALSLEKNEQARRQWVADISHELRTPLSVLRGEIEAIQDGVRQATGETIRSLHLEVMHLSRLVDDLYQLSLFDVGALTYRKTDLNLADVLYDAVESFRGEFSQKEIALKLQLPKNARFPVFADEQRLLQLFDNLLANALKYTDPKGELVVQLKREGGCAVANFQDSGPGVGPDDLGRLFDRLYRVESSRNRDSGGAGLGLSICKNIVEAHEGRIGAQGAPQGGVWIKVELPLTGGKG